METYQVDVHTIVTSMNEKLKVCKLCGDIAYCEPQGSGFIKRVSLSFGPWEDFKPKFISIGPLHFNRLDSDIEQQLKWKYLEHLFWRRRHDHDRQELQEIVVKHVKSIEYKVRQKYGEQNFESHNYFIAMLVVDGCFILELMLRNRTFEVLQLPGSLRLSLIRNDLLLLENQIPFFLLLELLQVLAPAPAGSNTGKYVVGLAVDLVNPSQHRCPLAVQESPENIHHLLHLYHMSICPPPRAQQKQRGQIANMFARCKIISLIGDFIDIDSPSGLLINAPRFIPTATELDELGVKFKKKEKHFWSFLDVTFDAAAGVMEIPVLTIDEGARSLFRNLIYFEQADTKGIKYSDSFINLISSLVDKSVNEVKVTRCGFNYCTSYVVLMSSLIDKPEDVAMLKRCGIIRNKVGSDEQAADLFKDLCATAILDEEEHYLTRVFEDVKHYTGSKHQRWKAQPMLDYFGNPWKTMFVIAAVIFLVLMTMLQTPYYHPHAN